MTVHSPHQDSHVHGLADGCPRCDEHANNPIPSLDSANLARLIEIAVAEDRIALCSSVNDMVATAQILTVLERVGRLAREHPEAVAEYFERWGIEATLTPRPKVRV